MVHSIKKYLKIIKILLSLSNQKIAEYRLSFYLTTVTIGLWLVADYVWILIIFRFTDFFADYNIWQYIGFLGFYFFLINLFWSLFNYSLNTLSDNIFEGKIDMMVVKPLDSQFLVSFNEFDIAGAFNFMFGLAVFIFAIIKLQLTVSIYQIVSLVVITLCSIISFYGIMFSVFTMTFWIGRSRAIKDITHMIFQEPSKVPSTAYHGGIKVLFYFIVPIALVATVPTSIFFFEIDYKLILYYTFFTIGVFLLSRLIWMRGLRSYTSVSS